MQYYQVITKQDHCLGIVYSNSFRYESDTKPKKEIVKTKRDTIITRYFVDAIKAEAYRQKMLDTKIPKCGG